MKVKKRNKKILGKKVKLWIKLIIVLIIILGLYFNFTSSSNKISLLAVSEVDGKVVDGSTLTLNLEVKPGTGNIYTNLNKLEELDTQISIINSQKIACRIFDLDCQNYDFYYTFEGPALILKGPSASSAIAVLVSKTLNNQKVSDDVVITGSLNSGGIIGNVGGIEQKVKVAEEEGFEKVLIPEFSDFNLENYTGNIQVIKVIDIIDVYNNYNGDNFKLDEPEISSDSYDKLMRELSTLMCTRAINLETDINKSLINNQSDLYNNLVNANESFESAIDSGQKENYYSKGSFCYNSNINYRIIKETQENQSNEEIENKIEQLKSQIEAKQIEIKTSNYKDSIETVNDFYVYLLINDRLNEAKKILESLDEQQDSDLELNNTNSTENIGLNLTNQTISKDTKIGLYSTALERMNTVDLWENLIVNSGKNINFDDNTIESACIRINGEIAIKSELLNNYEIDFFEELIEEQKEYNSKNSNKYLCLYKGLELNGRINTVLNTVGININETEYYSELLNNLTYTRLGINSEGEFPLIPYIYYEYSGDLINTEDYTSSLLYSNYALSYTDLNVYLEEGNNSRSFVNLLIENLFNNIIFIGGLLIVLVFL